MIRVRRALISVWEKQGVIPLAQALTKRGVEILSSGGTAQTLLEAGVPVIKVEDLTGFPEILGGRVKTLHPKVHGGILAKRTLEHLEELQNQGIQPIDLVVVNLYPFAQTVSKPGVTYAEAIEQIDIGGPTLIRAAAKNSKYVAVVTNPSRYPQIVESLEVHGGVSEELSGALALEAFGHTAAYDARIVGYLAQQHGGEPFPSQKTLGMELASPLRYGENPHQKAAFYRDPAASPGASLASAQQLQGKELSFNNIYDAAAALEAVLEFGDPSVVAVKHTNPCGVATAQTIFDAYLRAFEADPVSIFGGIVAANRPIDGATAQKMTEIFLEVVIAPGYTPEALEVFSRKPNLRVLVIPNWTPLPRLDIKGVPGGFLVQEADRIDLDPASLQVVTETEPTPQEWEDLRFGWRVVKHVKSNAIVVAKDLVTLGVGAGQMNRIDATRKALGAAGEKGRGGVLASDAFFPFGDVVEAAAAAGIRAIIQPGGSIRDQDSIERANAAGIAMVFTGIRHFRH